MGNLAARVTDQRVSSLRNVQNDILLLLNKMHKEMDCLQTIAGTEENLLVLRNLTAEINTILLSFGERFTEEAQPIELFQKIAFNELFHDEDISDIKGDASGSFGKVVLKVFRGQKVAVKIPKSERCDLKEEIRTLRTISHDNIISFRGWGEHDGRLFLVMEHLEKDLLEYVKEQGSDDNSGLSSRISWEIAKQIGQAMFYLHNLEIPIVHADLKPDNILLDTKPIIPKPKLCDFGLSCHEIKGEPPKGHKRYRVCSDEMEEVTSMDDFMKCDVFMFGLVVLVMRTGKSPYPGDETRPLKSAVMSSPIQKENGRFYVRKVKLPDLPSSVLGKLILSCCEKSAERPSFKDIMDDFFNRETTNPFNLAEKGEFFECGFLKDTQIFVADSMVQDTEGEESSNTPPGYRRDDLICPVDIVDKPYRDYPDDLKERYQKHYREFRKKARNKEIDDNPSIALSAVITDRSGDEETQKVELRYKEKTYCHHRAMRELWRSFEPDEKVALLPCLNEVNPIYSTSFGLHVAILTNEGPGKTKKFVFSRRSNKLGVVSPGLYTCGAVESCSTMDYLTPEKARAFVESRRKVEYYEDETQREREKRWKLEDERVYISLINTAARGLEEELGLPLYGADRDAITLNTIYLKFDNHEWGMCGFVDLTSKKIREEHQFDFAKLKNAFTAGPKDKYKHWQIYGVDFELRNMVEWIRENHDKLASSTKIVVVKVLQAFFGVAPVANEFAKKM